MTHPGHRLPLGRSLAILVAAALATAPDAGAQSQVSPPLRQRLERMIRDTTLANGLTVIVAENHTSPVATVEVTVRTGAFTQTGGDEGISHLFEHVLFRAFGDEDQWGADVARINALSNGMTSTEYVGYYITTPSERTERAAEMLAKLVVDPKFRGGDIESEMKIVVGEYERNASDPTFTLRERSERLLWGDAWSRKDPLGTPATINAIQKERLREVYDRYYVPNNTAIIISGDVSALMAFAWVEKYFGKWKARPDPFATPLAPIPPLSGPSVAVIPAPVDQVTLTVQWHGPSARGSDRDSYAADVFSDMLNSPVSPFQDRLVGSGLFQSLGVNYYTQDYTGPISITGITSIPHAEVAIKALRAEIERFDDPGYLTPELLAIAIKGRSVQTEFGLERGSSLAHSLAFWWSVTGIDYFLGYVDNMRTVTLDELNAYVAKYVSGRPFVAVALAPAAEAPKVEAAMTAAFGAGQAR